MYYYSFSIFIHGKSNSRSAQYFQMCCVKALRSNLLDFGFFRIFSVFITLAPYIQGTSLVTSYNLLPIFGSKSLTSLSRELNYVPVCKCLLIDKIFRLYFWRQWDFSSLLAGRISCQKKSNHHEPNSEFVSLKTIVVGGIRTIISG